MSKRASRPQTIDIYMDADKAAAALGVNVGTLYSYVSRKGIRTHKQHGQKFSQYLREDIERLQQGRSGATAAKIPPGLVPSSSITLLTEQGFFYRGVSTIELSKRASFEDAARLLWEADNDPFAETVDTAPPNWEALLGATRSYNPLDRATMLLPALEAANPTAYDLSRAGFSRNAADIIKWMFAIAFGHNRPSPLPIHRFIATATRCGPEIEAIVRQILVLSADQALEPITYAVRAVANTGASPYRCIAGGLTAASGNRHEGARTASFRRFVNEIDEADDPVAPINRRLRENEPLPGFGFSPFPLTGPDPRTIALRAAMKRSLRADKSYARFEKALRFAEDLSGKPADFSLLATWVSARLGMTNQLSLIRLSRSAGWIAHAMEQQARPLIRWKTNYSGPLP